MFQEVEPVAFSIQWCLSKQWISFSDFHQLLHLLVMVLRGSVHTQQSQGNKAARLAQGKDQVVDFEDESDEEEDGDGISVMTPQEEKHLKACLLETLKEYS
ncbi:hypothetical protein HOLleu_04275 [Holothuria leucospilota]|uniref:Uncharacterized protein n=1 Tax=Holothuria leucospilota TaxID=206669 RepID=A0A9Q1CUD8_HOLLE|nr:hypothetical protein HOLleu_04275 [Holothuria leucospilota]